MQNETKMKTARISPKYKTNKRKLKKNHHQFRSIVLAHDHEEPTFSTDQQGNR